MSGNRYEWWCRYACGCEDGEATRKRLHPTCVMHPGEKMVALQSAVVNDFNDRIISTKVYLPKPPTPPEESHP